MTRNRSLGALIHGLPCNCIFQLTSFSRREDHQPGQKWVHRTVYCYYANSLIDPLSVPFPAEEDSEGGVEPSERPSQPFVTDQFFETEILPDLLRLTNDHIVNVRLCAARCLKNILQSRPYFKDTDNPGS